MAIFQAILASLGRSAGRLLNMAFSWATILLFGRVSQARQAYLSVIAFGSVAWLTVVLGVIFPAVGVFLLSFVSLPAWVNRNWVRLAMLVAALLIPLLVGHVALHLTEPEDRPRGKAERWKALLRGYPETLGFALTLIMLLFFAPVLKIRTVMRRWANQHVPMLVEPRDYVAMIGDVRRTLSAGGWRTQECPANWMLRFPVSVLTLLTGGGLQDLVAERLTVLRSDKLEALLYPADLIISAAQADAAHARELVTERLAFSRAHFTWTKEANHLEDRLRSLWREVVDRSRHPASGEQEACLKSIDHDLRRLAVEYEEWEVLYREKLQVQSAIYQRRAGEVPAEAREPAGVGASGDRHAPAPPPAPSVAPRARDGSRIKLAAFAVLGALAWLGARVSGPTKST